MNKAHGITWYPFSMWLNLGWYPGDPFKGFCLTVLEISRNYKTNELDFVTILSVQLSWFVFGFGWHKTDE